MESISISKKEFGIFIGVFTAVIAVVALLTGKQRVRRNTMSRYEGWYDSLGI